MVEGDTEDADSHRYAAVGNAVSVPVIHWIAERIKVQLNDDSTDILDEGVKQYAAFEKSAWIDLPNMDTPHNKLVWGKSGLMWSGRYLIGEHRDLPCIPMRSSLYEIVEKGETKPRYYLTPNAAEGILRRVDNNNRRLFEPLREGLEVLSGRKIRR